MIRVVTLGLLLAVAGCGTLDTGGHIADRMQHIREGTAPALIDYPCRSSCTLYLTNPSTCYTPEARFYFHGATNRRGKLDPVAGRQTFARFWPALRSTLLENEAHLLTGDRWFVMTGAQVAALDTVERMCG